MEILTDNNEQSLFIDILSDIICQYLESEHPEHTESPETRSTNDQMNTEAA